MQVNRWSSNSRVALSQKVRGLSFGESLWVTCRKAGRWVSVCVKRNTNAQFQVGYIQFRAALVGHEADDKLKFGKGGETYKQSLADIAKAANDLVHFLEHCELDASVIRSEIKSWGKDTKVKAVVEILPMFPLLPASIEVESEPVLALAAI